MCTGFYCIFGFDIRQFKITQGRYNSPEQGRLIVEIQYPLKKGHQLLSFGRVEYIGIFDQTGRNTALLQRFPNQSGGGPFIGQYGDITETDRPGSRVGFCRGKLVVAFDEIVNVNSTPVVNLLTRSVISFS